MTASGEPAADARAPGAPRIRGISNADAFAVVIIAAVLAAFLGSHGLVGYVLIGAIALIYAAFRTTRGLPMLRRLLAITATFAVTLTVAALLDYLGL